ncbi:MAG TPA: hypothetical protein PKH33_11060 [bacterium]|nr:hypothetical protein [bacterium]
MNIDMKWTPHPSNPLISPVWPEWLVGDPVVLTPEESPDGRWHMFLNSVLFIYRYTSGDGIKWQREQRVCRGMRAWLLPREDDFILYHESFITPWRSDISARVSRDLENWSAPRKVLSPSLPWEMGAARNMSCPCVVKDGSVYRMYYSSNSVFLKDLGFGEPKYIGVAEADNPFGPFVKRREPILSPNPGHAFRNMGAGAIKVYRDDENERWIGFNNGIFTDEKKRSRSAIMLLTSKDGISWEEPFAAPIISPDKGWRKALVYQLCLAPRPNGEIWVYYNSRDGWRFGSERIGLEIGRPLS